MLARKMFGNVQRCQLFCERYFLVTAMDLENALYWVCFGPLGELKFVVTSTKALFLILFEGNVNFWIFCICKIEKNVPDTHSTIFDTPR